MSTTPTHLRVHQFAGLQPGPRLLVSAAVHGNETAGIGAIHNKLGNVYQSQYRLEEALQENHEALRIFERIGPPAKEALILAWPRAGECARILVMVRLHSDAPRRAGQRHGRWPGYGG